jgi:hypothetical protein
MRHGNLQSHQARKVTLCLYCKTDIEVGDFYLSLNYKTKSHGWFARKFHSDCLRFWLQEQYDIQRAKPKKGSAGPSGGRPVLTMEPEEKKLRRKLLQYLNTRDVRGLVNAYLLDIPNPDKVRKWKLRMLTHIDQLEGIGVPYPQPFKSQDLWQVLDEYEPELVKALESADTWTERIKVLRSSTND